MRRPTRAERRDKLMMDLMEHSVYGREGGGHEIRYGVKELTAVLDQIEAECGPDDVPRNVPLLLRELQRAYDERLGRSGPVIANLEGCAP